MKSITRFFSSVKLAIVLLIIITLASILGTLVPQHRSTAEYAARYGQMSGLLVSLEITRLYSSWWFLSLLLLFSLNTVVCTLTRFRPKYLRAVKPGLAFEAKSLASLKITDSFQIKGNLREAGAGVAGALKAKGYRIRSRDEEGRIRLAGRKKMFGLFGSDVVHLGLLVILLGGIISGLLGFRADISISEGKTMDVPNADFALRLDKFVTEYYPDGRIKDWKSDLVVVKDGRDMKAKTVEVNHPLTYGGFVFYQSSYGWDWKDPTIQIVISRRDDPASAKMVSLKMGRRTPVEGEDFEVAALNFVPDFIIGENSQVATRSLQPNNPAAYIEGLRGEDKVFAGWVFQKYPDFGQMHSQEETVWDVKFMNFKSGQIAGIQAAKDPGVNFIWAGSALLMLGLMVAFFWPPREIKAVLTAGPKAVSVTAGGVAAKNRESFIPEFQAIMQTLRRKK
jgi:cytochrome c biogenesis protein